MKPITREDALAYHLGGKPGKLSVIPSKPLNNQYDLGLAYTPGVAYPVLEVELCAECAYDYTNKGNLVGVISNGTAILGLGDRGALASKPVMEGKGVLFKKFADIDVFDIEVAENDPEAFIQIVQAIAPTFGGINLEDIRSPECFMIERRLQAALDIPVFHDDQHGTAIILAAGLLNALELVGKRLDSIKVVFSGGGAAGVACASHLLKIGLPLDSIWMCDRFGLVRLDRKEEMYTEKDVFARDHGALSLAECMEGADVFIGLSAANIVTPAMLKRMGRDPIIFAMANPDPEIPYELARQTRPDAVVATGRSDCPNQINNVLGFPFIFRGALDVRARAINNEMKIAASQALAQLARQPVPGEVLHAYGLNGLEFGKDYIVPKPLDRRVCHWEAPAVAKAALDTGVARKALDIEDYRQCLERRCPCGDEL
jgi:malate dehydrogenase (oxaloacetate-decarboxylating)(NADP+)